jgi:hypothetical protein
MKSDFDLKRAGFCIDLFYCLGLSILSGKCETVLVVDHGARRAGGGQ